MKSEPNGISATWHYINMVSRFLLLTEKEKTWLYQLITITAASLYIEKKLGFVPTPRQIALSVANKMQISSAQVETVFKYIAIAGYREHEISTDIVGDRRSLITMFSKLIFCPSKHIEVFVDYYCFDPDSQPYRQWELLRQKHGSTTRNINYIVMAVWHLICPSRPNIPVDRLKGLAPRGILLNGIGGKIVPAKPLTNIKRDYTSVIQTNTESNSYEIELVEKPVTQTIHQTISRKGVFDTMVEKISAPPTALSIQELVRKLVVHALDKLISVLNGGSALVNRDAILVIAAKYLKGAPAELECAEEPTIVGVVPISELVRQQLNTIIDDITSGVNGEYEVVKRENIISIAAAVIEEMAPTLDVTKITKKRGRKAQSARENPPAVPTPMPLVLQDDSDKQPFNIPCTKSEKKALSDRADFLAKEFGVRCSFTEVLRWASSEVATLLVTMSDEEKAEWVQKNAQAAAVKSNTTAGVYMGKGFRDMSASMVAILKKKDPGAKKINRPLMARVILSLALSLKDSEVKKRYAAFVKKQ